MLQARLARSNPNHMFSRVPGKHGHESSTQLLDRGTSNSASPKGLVQQKDYTKHSHGTRTLFWFGPCSGERVHFEQEPYIGLDLDKPKTMSHSS